MSEYASVLLDLAIDKALDYAIPKAWQAEVRPGMRVEVPVKGRPSKGYILALKSQPSVQTTLPILRLLSDSPLLTSELFEIAVWMSRYYCTPIHRVIRSMLPASVRKETRHKMQLYVVRHKSKAELQEHCLEIRQKFPAQAAIIDVMLQVKKGVLLTDLLEQAGTTKSPVEALEKKGYLLVDIVRVDRSPFVNEEYFPTKPKTLTPEQSLAFTAIVDTLTAARFETHLIHGVTGSGKTEVYLQAIEKALSLGKGAIVLVPEISLTVQTAERFRSRFEKEIAILHHRLSEGERFDEWHRIRRGEAKIVIGARSAIFSPVVNLGLIIVDEEHESSYKQTDEMPCYHARDTAVMRGKMCKGCVVLGSATPSLESYWNGEQGKYRLHTLKSRPDAITLPKVTIVDMRQEFAKAKGWTNFSDSLLTGIKKRQEAGEQAILFLNRRGYHTMLLCQGCGLSVKCPHCNLSLTYHQSEKSMSCHLCSFTLSPPPKTCSHCHREETMKWRGVGTELIEKSLQAIFPDVRTLRIDADTTRHKGSHQLLLRRFGAGKADVLIGTQMVAKGLHFPEVTLVGILNCDASLNIPDFRASEQTFQLITQVAGRAGRGLLPGEVILQTCLPENRTIQLAAEQDFLGFYKEESATRQLFDYPPYCRLIKVLLSGTEEVYTQQAAVEVRLALLQQLPTQFQFHPVTPAGYQKIKGRFRFQFLLRGPSPYVVSAAFEKIKRKIPLSNKIKLIIDVDPISTF